MEVSNRIEFIIENLENVEVLADIWRLSESGDAGNRVLFKAFILLTNSS